MMEYRVRHRTVYRYLQDVSYSCHIAHLMPRETSLQKVRSAELELSVEPTRRYRMADFFGNTIEWFSVDHPHTVFEIVAESRVTVSPPESLDASASMPWEDVRDLVEAADEAETRAAVQYVFDSPLTAFEADIASYALKSFPPRRPLLAAAMDLMSRIHKDFRYDSTVTDATTPVDHVFEIRAGVCQDLAHMGIASLRSLGLPARYVSGYLLTQPPPGKPRLIGADASHAWFSLWVPPYGWVDLDPTNDVRVGESHVIVGWGRDYSDVAPINGIITGGANHIVEVGVDVAPI